MGYSPWGHKSQTERLTLSHFHLWPSLPGLPNLAHSHSAPSPWPIGEAALLAPSHPTLPLPLAVSSWPYHPMSSAYVFP